MKAKIIAFGLVLVFLLSATAGMASAFSFGDFTEKQSNIAILVLDHDNLENVEAGYVSLIKGLGYSPKIIEIDQVKAGSIDLSDYKLIIVPTYGTANVRNAYSSDVVEREVIKATNSGTNWILAQSGSIILKKLGLTTIKAGEPPGWIPALADSTFAVNAITSSPTTEDVPTMPDFPGGYSLDDLDSRDLPSLIWRVDPNERSRYVWLNIDEIKIEPSYLLNVAGTGWHIGKPHPGLPEWKVGDSHIIYFHHLWNVDPGNGGDGYIGQAGLKLLNNAIKCYSKAPSTIKPTPTPPSPESLFRVTAGKYSETADLGDVIKNEFGDNYRLADWNDILAYSDDIQSWAKSVGMEHGDSYLVSRNAERFWSGKRHYFITRHDHNCPGNWLVHDHIDDHFIDLGSWYDMKKQVLCIKTTLPTKPTPSPEMELLYQNKDDDGIWIEIYGPHEPPLNSKVDYAVFITLAETERKSREGKGNIYDMFEGFVYIAYPDDYVNTYPGDELLTKILYENEEQWYSQNIAEGLKKHEGGMEVVNILMSVACKIPGLWGVISNQILPSVSVPPKNSVFFDDNTHDI
ncbi:hypothetical protein CW714_02060 [Methanophagales archaeon]|nr:MAG: hypothetical protein CW714_02060 [Methanophagales archaeon]